MDMCVKQFLLACFALFRLSHLVPNKVSEFDVTHHLFTSDLILGTSGAHMIFKRGKCMQGSNQHRVVQIRGLSVTLLCPVTALKVLTLKYQYLGQDSPLFVLLTTKGYKFVTALQVGKVFASILLKMGHNHEMS